MRQTIRRDRINIHEKESVFRDPTDSKADDAGGEVERKLVIEKTPEIIVVEGGGGGWEKMSFCAAERLQLTP